MKNFTNSAIGNLTMTQFYTSKYDVRIHIAKYGVWGTCVDCPRDGECVYPHLCVYANRYDHQLKPEDYRER